MTHRPRLLAIMGSGETAPTMARVHRLLVERLGAAPVDAVLLDSPYGFQENAPEISRRAVGYFQNLQVPLEVVSWRTADDVLARERALARVADADYVFAGPGSPTYALGVWERSRLPEVLAGKLTGGGCLTFASAAAATLGALTVPVYEIYKVGAAPYWARGMDLLARIGLRAAVIPHYDNTEGGTHDTRFCYLGERRLRTLESMMTPDTVVLGVDEHTAAVLDLDTDTVTVLGRGALTVRRHGSSTLLTPGAPVPLEEFRAIAAGSHPTPSRARHHTPDTPRPPPSLRARAHQLAELFTTALGTRDVTTALTATLQLEQAIVDWSADTEEADSTEEPRAILRQMITRLAQLATLGARDPRQTLAPLVEALLELREHAREQGSWALADTLRDRLTTAGIEVRDTPQGPVWLLTGHPGETDATDQRAGPAPGSR
ncbi:MAG: hypothetical protein JO364_18465 [Pseudonocardiales bacterium]|nr:hypothetical protein [Pseudonocardiales bacterium]MBV9032243.1 hypothetical protein [Pseudonocardiales bacterium]